MHMNTAAHESHDMRPARQAVRALVIFAALLGAGACGGGASTKSATSTAATSSSVAGPTVAAPTAAIPPGPTPTVGPAGLIGQPSGVAVDAAGNVYFSTNATCLLRKLSQGVVTKVAGEPGGHVCGSSPDGPAASSKLNHPLGVAVAPNGDVYIADSINCSVRKLSGDLVTTVAGAGAGQCVYNLDAGSALSVHIYPSAVAVDAQNNVYIADWANCRIREVSGGNITTVAGVGTGALAGCGGEGDGGSATAAQLNKPFGVAVGAGGDVYISDTSDCKIRMVHNGTIHTFAGTGAGAPNCTSSGDGGLATAAGIGTPIGIAAGNDGAVYIADAGNCNVRRVGPDGVVTTVAGISGTPAAACGFAGDGGPATSAKLGRLSGIALDPDGSLYIADDENCRIREVVGGVINTIAGSAVCDGPVVKR